MRAAHKRAILLSYIRSRVGSMTINRRYCLHSDKCNTLKDIIKRGDVTLSKSFTSSTTSYTVVKTSTTTEEMEPCPECKQKLHSLSVNEHKDDCSYRLDPISNYESNHKRVQKTEIPRPISARRRMQEWKRRLGL